MQSLNEEESKAVLGEVLNDQLQAILEYVKEIPSIKRDITSIKHEMADLKYLVNGHELDISYLRKKLV